MHEQRFEAWLTKKMEPIQENSAKSYVSYAKSCERLLSIDLDVAFAKSTLDDLLNQIGVVDRAKNTKRNYATALRNYSEFRRSNERSGRNG